MSASVRIPDLSRTLRHFRKVPSTEVARPIRSPRRHEQRRAYCDPAQTLLKIAVIGIITTCSSSSAASRRERSFRFWSLSRIEHRPIVANDGASCQARQIDIRFSENMHHLLACGQKIVGDDPAVATPPDRFGAHDDASLLRAAFPQPRQTGSEWRRQGIVCVVAKAAHSPIGIGGGPSPGDFPRRPPSSAIC